MSTDVRVRGASRGTLLHRQRATAERTRARARCLLEGVQPQAPLDEQERLLRRLGEHRLVGLRPAALPLHGARDVRDHRLDRVHDVRARDRTTTAAAAVARASERSKDPRRRRRWWRRRISLSKPSSASFVPLLICWPSLCLGRRANRRHLSPIERPAMKDEDELERGN